jgi:hypothetical protein
MRDRRRTLSLLAAALLAALLVPGVADASPPQAAGDPELWVSGLAGGAGSAVGPDGALYVTEPGTGQLTRIDAGTGQATVVATCLPERVAPFPGGAVDVTFKGWTAYVLVTLVSPHVGGTAVAGIYRIDGPDECTLIADIGTWSAENPPEGDFDAPVVPGVQFALEYHWGGFVVTDGHHNRVLFVRNGNIRQLIQLPNVVPTGLDVADSKVYLALAGPVPHVPEDGRIVSFHGTESPDVRVVAGGASLLVDVELCGRRVFGLGQGEFPEGQPPGAPALPGTGELRVADRHGDLDLIVDGLDQPTSLTFIGDAAYVVTLGGDVWKIPGVCPRHHGDDEGDRED